jgi:very-short-patch-repair endonuclease
MKKGSKMTVESRAKLSASHTGLHPTEETRKKLSLAKMGNRYWVGRKHTPEAIVNMRAAQKGHGASPEARANMGKAQKGRKHPQEILEKIRRTTAKALSSPSVRAKMSIEHKARYQDPVYCANYARGMNMKPNRAELKLLALLEALYPGEWKYTGDFSFVINGKNPDFVCCNGQKKVIELFGDYWHKGDDPKERAKVFAPFGYKTLVIWERELRNGKKLIERIRRFVMQ